MFVCALCLAAHAEHIISALYGSGRYGKGSFIRVIQGIPGNSAVMLRPRELAESKFADDANKRTLSTPSVRGCPLRMYTQRRSCGCNGRVWRRMHGH